MAGIFVYIIEPNFCKRAIIYIYKAGAGCAKRKKKRRERIIIIETVYIKCLCNYANPTQA